MTCQEAVQLASERLAVLWGVRCRSAGINARAAELVHHLAHRQILLDILTAKPASAWVKHIGALVEDRGGESYVRGNDEVPAADQFDDTVIGDVEARRTCSALIKREGGVRRYWLATSVTYTLARCAARYNISLTTTGQASASTSTCIAVLPIE
ncbi:hypothetical protein AU476_01805 [Cupriavidus sp. UYMSc13B]|nr:hypothetical protein AU476_01805 [Cupriavidus sp. UYMSc13B]